MTKAEILDIIYDAKTQGSTLFVEEGKLGIKKTKGTRLSSDLLNTIKGEKEAIIDFLNVYHNNSFEYSTILPVKRPEKIPMSFAQERLWFIDKLQGSIPYHMSEVLRIKGELNIQALKEAIYHLVEKHEALRTVFKEYDGVGYQQIIESKPFEVKLIEKKRDNLSMEDMIKEEVEIPFDLSSDFMVRATLYKESTNEHLLILVLHHIAGDGWSMPILVNEIENYYEQLSNDRPVASEPLIIQYADYSIWQRDFLSGSVLVDKLKFWEDQLKGFTTLKLPTDHPRPAVQSTEGSVFEFTIEQSITQKLKNIAQHEGATLFMVLLAVYKVLLYRYTGQTDISVGTPVANRNRREVENIIGFFVNTLVIRDQLSAKETFRQIVNKVKQSCLQAYQNQDVPLEKIIDHLSISRDQSQNPLFQTLFSLQNNRDITEIKLGENKVELITESNKTSKFDITFDVSETSNGLAVSIEYATAIFEIDTIKRMASHYQQLVFSIVDNIEKPLSQLEIIPKAEKMLLDSFSANTTNIGQETHILAGFEEQVAKNPNGIALVQKEVEITYRLLDQHSSQLANYLVECGVTRDTLIPFCLERSCDVFVVMLAILKAGGAYIPIEINYPASRIEYILKDSSASTVIISEKYSAVFENLNFDTEIIALESVKNRLATYSKKAPNVKILPEQLAYAIYTSGTTGKPKGTLIEHKSISRLCYLSELTFDEQTRMLQLASISFDAAGIEIWTTLLRGGTLIIYPDADIDLARLNEVINQHKVNTTWFTAGLLDQWVQHPIDNDTFKYIIAGGDILTPASIRKLHEALPQVTVINGYGPTENTVLTTSYEIPRDFDVKRSIPIGYPLPGTSVFIMDEQLQLVPIGVIGELLTSGIGLSRGYLNQVDLTNEKFIEHPFIKGVKLYRTGDLARWNANGVLEFFGRKDQQIKLRGYRIELGEIETTINEIDSIKQAVVVVRNDTQNRKQLVAYFQTESVLDIKDLKLNLQEKLPAYMIPSAYVKVDEFPLNSNGKIDRRKLPEPGEDAFEREAFVAPVSQDEIKLSQLWTGVLGVQKIGINDNFFALGGDSIKAIQLVSRCHAAGFHLKVKDVFKHQTISELITKINSSHHILAETGFLEGSVPLHPIQQMFFEQNFNHQNHYNQSVLLTISRSINQETLKHSLALLVERHDALRLHYSFEEGREAPLQSYVKANSNELLEEHIHNLQELEAVCSQYQASLNIENGTIFKFVLIHTPKEEAQNRLFFTVHHLAVDGVSWRIILEDLANFIKTFQAGYKPSSYSKGTSYRQWVEKLTAYSNSQTLETELNYWQEILNNFQPIVTDFPKGKTAATYNETKSIITHLSPSETLLLQQDIHRAYGTQMNDILLSALALSLQVLSEAKELVIALEGHGREEIFGDIDISRTVGWFTSMYPVCLNLSFSKDALANLIAATKDMLNDIPEKGIGYGVLRYLSGSKEIRESLQKPFESVVFNYLGDFDNSVSDQEDAEMYLDFATEESGAEISGLNQNNHLISVNSMIVKGQLQLEWSYDSTRFKEETIQKIAASYVGMLQHIIEHCSQVANTVMTPGDYGLPREVTFESLQTFLNSSIHQYEIEDVFVLSPLQEGMLFHSLYATDAAAYMVQFQCDIMGSFSQESFNRSWSYLMEKHSILRTAIFNAGLGTPVQCVYKNIPVPVKLIDYTALSEEEALLKIANFLEHDQATAFDLNKSPLFRITLFRINQGCTRLVFTNHHLLWDGWSFSKLISNFMECYEAVESENTLPEITFDNFGDHVRSVLNKNQEAGLLFWKKYLSGVSSPVYLPFVKDTSLRNKVFGDQEYNVSFSEDTCGGIQQLCEKYHVTMNTLIQAGWSFLLAKYTGQNEIAFGATVSGRDSDIEGIEDKIGLYINTIPVCTSVNEKEEIGQWLTNLQESHTTAREEYSYLPLGLVETQTSVKETLFDTLLVFENYPVEEGASGTFRISNAEAKDTTNYTLSISVFPSSDGISLKYMFNDQLLDQTVVSTIHDHLSNVIQSLSEGLQFISDINYLAEEESQILLEDFNQTAIEFGEGTVLDLFAEQVECSPESPAIYTEDTVVSYASLEQHSNLLAHYLLSCGIMKGSIVPVCFDRSFEMYVNILALLKCGAAYVPIDPEYPSHRIGMILEDLSAKWVLTQKEHLVHFESVNGLKAIFSEDYQAALSAMPDTAPEVALEGDDLAYIIYTSGTTGVPKGVMITHDSLYGLLRGMASLYPLKRGDRMAFKTNYGFDVSVYELFGWLTDGGSMVIVPQGIEKDPKRFLDFLETSAITHLNLVPSLFGVLLEALSASENTSLEKLRYLFLAGEALPSSMVASYHALGLSASLINIYGPTEGTIYSTYYETTPDSAAATSISIGKPLPNTRAYIVDDSHRLLPVGVVGELCISGRGLAKGYYHREELTASKFIAHPFIEGERLYKTGDLASWTPDGQLRYVGRKDSQVKLRGYRIELGDISSVLDQHPGIRHSVAMVREGQAGNQQLVCYYTGEATVALTDIKAWLSERLPSYMVPQVYVLLESFPLSASGKIDRKALPVPEASSYQTATYEAPQSPTELQLASIWRELLQLEKIGVHDNFFELGGHSILAMRVVSRVQIATKKAIDVIVLFENPTISGLAKVIDAPFSGVAYSDVPSIPLQEVYPCSAAQTRIWLADQVSQNRAVYNITSAFEIKGSIKKEFLFEALQHLVGRHEILRTNYIDYDGIPYQKVREFDEAPVNFEVIECIDIQNKAQEILKQENAYEFDLLNDPLIRFRLVTDKERHVFIINIHHIAGDGWSLGILQEDLLAYYNAISKNDTNLKPAPLSVQYKDYASWHNAILQDPDKQAMAYWKHKLWDVSRRKELPLDKPRTQIRGTEAEEIEFSLGRELSLLIQNTARKNQTGIFTVLQTLLKSYLHDYLETEDIIIGTPVAGRNHPQLEEQIGFYVNVVALRTKFTSDETFNSLLKKITKETQQAFKHQFYPFEEIIKDLNIPRELGRNQLFDVLISYTDGLEKEVNHSELSFHELESGLTDKRNKYDLSFGFHTESAHVITATITYNTNLFFEDSMLQIKTTIPELFKKILTAPQKELREFKQHKANEVSLVDDFS
jgi:amino acid adenylation domain-containing protein/non-ribosomal peptide synthase protein (TIGR01720 family)